ncbi:ComEA family DNA-binding protein [Caproiciproducens sp.]
MDDETLHVRYLMVIAAVLFALIIGYNAFYVPEVSLSDLVVTTDASSSADETYIPKTGSEAPSSVGGTPAVNGKINVNTATVQQISDGLDGIGDVIAKRIVDYREKNGPFKSVEEIRKVSGIGEKTFAGLKDHITVS